jgi:signal transduction histidine kinase
LINDLLDVSRISSGKFALEWSTCDIREIVDAAVDSIGPASEAKQIVLTIDRMNTGVDVACDPARLQQAITNVLSNAVKFTRAGGRIEVRVEADAINTSIVVTDTGVGIGPDFLPFVFERFRQEDGSSTRNFGGLGIGLSISRQIIEMHRGTIRASSAGLNQGAAFTIEIPRLEVSSRLG